MASSVDLLIVGAGPAGCAAAVAARRAAPSLSVAVVDAARFPRDKLCGGALTGGGLAELARAGLALRVPHATVEHAELRVDGVRRRVRLPRAAAVVRRRDFDADLVAQVRAAGVDVVEEAALLRLAGNCAFTSRGAFAYRALVAADGSAGSTRRLLGLGPGERAPLREAALPPGGNDALVFDLDAGVAGYAWRFPCAGPSGSPAENAGVYAFARGADLAAALARFEAREGLPTPRPDAWSLRLAAKGMPVGEGNALLAGDALGADPLAGEGLRYALWSGRIAGRLAACALGRGEVPSPEAYRRRLAASRSGLTLAFFVRVARRLYGPHAARWRRVAADPRAARLFAAIVSRA